MSVNVCGHRGAGLLEPENTLAAFQMAIDMGLDSIEFDVHVPMDNEHCPIVIHGPSLEVTTNGKGMIADTPFEVLRKLDASMHQSKGHQIPTLEEVFALCKGRIGLQVELKGEGSQFAAPLLAERMNVLGQCKFNSFFGDRLHSLKKKYSDAFTTLTVHKPLHEYTSEEEGDLWKQMEKIGASGFDSRYTHITEEWVQEAKKRNMRVMSWTPGGVNETEEELERLVKLGVDVMCVNRPDLLLRILGREARPKVEHIAHIA